MTLLKTDKVDIRLDHGVLIITVLVDHLTSHHEIQEMADQIKQTLGEAETGVVVDCALLQNHVSSEFLGMLVGLYKETTEKNLAVSVCSVGGVLKEAFDIMKLDRICPLYTDVQEAIYTLGKFRPGSQEAKYQVARWRYIEAKREGRVIEEEDKTSWERLQTAARDIPRAIAALPLEDYARPALGVLYVVACLGLVGYLIYAVWPDRIVTVARISGSVTYRQQGGKSLPDEGALIIAWPADAPLSPKITSDTIAVALQSDSGKPKPLLFEATRAEADGSYTLKTGFARDFFVLLISARAGRAGPLKEDEKATLSNFIEAPAEFLGERSYHLTRVWIPSEGRARLKWQFPYSAVILDPDSEEGEKSKPEEKSQPDEGTSTEKKQSNVTPGKPKAKAPQKNPSPASKPPVAAPKEATKK